MAAKLSTTSKVLRVLAGALGLGVVLYAVAAAVLSTQWFHRYLVQRVTVGLADLTGTRVEIRGLEVRPLIFQATLRGLVLHGKESPLEPPLFQAETIVLGLEPRSITRRKLLLRRLDVIDAQANIRTYPDGSTNIPGPESSLLDDLVNWSIGTLTVSRSSFSWDNQHASAEISARNVAVLLRYGLGGRYSGTLAASETKVNSGAWLLPPVTFATRLQFSRRDLELSDFNGRLTASSGFSGRGWLKLSNLPNLDAEFSFQGGGDVLRMAQILKIPELRGGSFTGECQGTYRDGQARGQGRLQAREVAIASPVFISDRIGFATDYSLDGHHVALTRLAASLLEGSAQGRADVTLDDSSPRFAAKLQVRGIDLARGLRAVSERQTETLPFPVASRVEGSLDASWRGNFRNPQARFDLTFTPIEDRPSARPVGGFVKGSATMSPAASLDLEGAELHTPHSSLSLKGSVRAQQSNLAVTFTTSDSEEWKPLAGSVLGGSGELVLESTAAFAGSISGPARGPDIQGRLKVGAFKFRGWSWDGLEGTLDAAPEWLRVSGGKLLGRAGTLMFDGSLGLDHWRVSSQSPLRLAAQTELTSIEGLRDTLNIHTPVTGLVTGRLNIEGTPAALAGSGSLGVERGAFAGEPFDRLSANVRVAKSLWTFDALQLRKGSGKVTGRAAVDLSAASVSLDLHGSDFGLSGFKLLEARLPQSQGKQPFIDGRLSFDLQAQGTRDHPQLQSKFSLQSLQVNGTTLGELQGQCEWHGEQLQVQIGVEGPGGKLHTTGVVKTQGDWPAELNTEYSDLRADPWMGLLRGRALTGAALTSAGSFSVTGPLKTPARLEAHGKAEKIEVGLPDLKWTNDQPVDLTYANGVLTAGRFRLRGPSTDLQVEGSIHLAKPVRISCSVQGHGDAQLLQVFQPALESTGTFDLNLRAAGTTEQPSLNGTLAIKGLSLAFGEVPFRLVGLNGDIQFEGDHFTVRSLRGAGSGGSVEINGNGTIYGTPRFDFRASLNQARIEFPPEITSSLSGTLHLVGTPQGGQLSGELSIQHSFVREDFNLVAWMGQVGNQPLASPATLTSPWASKVSLDVGVTSSPDVRLESHDLKLVATIDMNVRGTLANPVGFGDVHIESGEAVIRGNRYKLTRGDINLTNPFRTQATVDLEAQTRVQHYDLTLQVTGPTDRLKISYRSDPPLPTSDILAVLALGYSRQQQTLSATGSSQFSSLGTSALLSQALSTQVSGRLQRLFGVSRIKVDPSVYGPGVGGGLRVTVEEQLTRDFSLTYSTNTAGSQQELIQFEYALSDRISLIGERDQNGVYGVEVRFRHRFK